MSINSKKSINISWKVIMILFLMFPGTGIYASECGMMQFLAAKSSGVITQNNQCNDNRKVSLGTEFNMSSKARLWLKSLEDASSDSHFQVICQNQSVTSVKLSVSSIFVPWINPEGLNNCSGWVNNKLGCDDAQGNHNRFFCVIANIKNPSFEGARKIERTTSVKMRKIDIGSSKPVDFSTVIAAIEPEIELCRNLYQIRQPINVSWTVTRSGSATDIDAQLDSLTNPQFSECVTSVISDFAYPGRSDNLAVVHKF